LQPLPGFVRMEIIGLRSCQDIHLFLQPSGAIFALELGTQVLVDRNQVSYVGKGVFKLTLGERTMAPIREARSLVDPLTSDTQDQLIVRNTVAETAYHCGNLGIKYRGRDEVAQMIDNLDILTRRVEDLRDPFVPHELEKRGKVHSWRKRVDESGHPRCGQLN